MTLDTLILVQLDDAVSRRTTPWPTGTPCWVDLGVPDVDTTAQFYAAVLGWQVRAAGPAFDESEAGGYVIGAVDGAAAAGIGPQAQPGPSAWTLYFATDDLDSTDEAIRAHGGSLVVPAADVGSTGRMAVAVDPTGAVFGLWQADGHLGAEVVNEPGALTWEDLRSPEPDVARAFYAAVFGYAYQPVDGAPDDYTTFAFAEQEDHPLGGMGALVLDGQTPHWLVTFGVVDAQAAADTAYAHGGVVSVPLSESPYGRMVGLTDPAGATFWVVENGS